MEEVEYAGVEDGKRWSMWRRVYVGGVQDSMWRGGSLWKRKEKMEEEIEYMEVEDGGRGGVCGGGV